MPRPILQYPNSALRVVSDPVFEFGEALSILAIEMFEAMRHREKPSDPLGVGLAANQIGVFQRVIVIDTSGKGLDELVMVNPRIVRAEGTQQVNDGCLSVNRGRTFRRTTRFKRIVVEYQDIYGTHRKRKAAGDLAHVIQHECDHLDGKVYLDLAITSERRTATA